MTKKNHDSSRDPQVAGLNEVAEDEASSAAPGKNTASRTQPQHFRSMQAPDAQAIITGVCGDTMGIFLRTNGNTIEEATFLSDGCTPAVAYANLLTTMVQGMPLSEARRIKPQDLILELRRVLDDHDHCAKLVVNTLREALSQAGHATDTGAE